MIWRLATALIVALTVTLVGFMYLRDRDTSAARLDERRLAAADGREVLGSLTTVQSCAGGCRADAIDRVAPSVWRVRLQTPTWRRCFELQIRAFGYSPETGFRGLRSVSCP